MSCCVRRDCAAESFFAPSISSARRNEDQKSRYPNPPHTIGSSMIWPVRKKDQPTMNMASVPKVNRSVTAWTSRLSASGVTKQEN